MREALQVIYQRLFRHFGPQHWWPARTPFEVMVGAILTQNTNWKNVERAIDNLRQHHLLEARALYQLDSRKLASLIRPSGYYNIKAKRLKEFLKFFMDRYQGDAKKMFRLGAGVLREQLLAVKGIGPETADSILLYALAKPAFVVDAYTKRILSRHRLVKEDATYVEVQNLFMQNLQNKVELFNEFHALLVRLGKEFCLKSKPKCLICPLR